MLHQFFEIRITSFWVCVSSICKGMNEKFFEIFSMRYADQTFEMINVRVNPTVRKQSDQMKILIVFDCIIKRFIQYRIFIEFVFFDSLVYTHEVLVHYASSA